uniref:Uncharacterized protein n=1 Tax=mine drainage metagenome TaxID=410659 RepID=E6PYH4_9ZZZZ
MAARIESLADADEAHHAAGAAVLGAMREESRGLTGGTAAERSDAARAEASGKQLTAVGFDEVEFPGPGLVGDFR